MTQKKHKLPKYRQIEKDIVDHINANFYSADDPLPTESELMQTYKVSRVTVRQALGNLVEKGFVYRKQGSGSFVAPKDMQRKSPKLKSFTEEMGEQNRVVSTQVISFNIVEAGEEVSRRLRIKPDERAYFIERLRLSDGEALMFERTFMSVNNHNEISIADLEGSKFEYVDSKGMIIDYSDQNIDAILSTTYISNLLEIEVNSPLIRIENTTYLVDGTILEYTELYMHPDKYQFSIVKTRK